MTHPSILRLSKLLLGKRMTQSRRPKNDNEKLVRMKKQSKIKIFTIGHSIHDLKTFKTILKTYNINQVIDIRSIPKSRHNPQFNFETLPTKLRNAKIGYRHIKNLGGLRHAKKDSINIGWHNTSFRGFADYMQTEEFEAGIELLIKIAKKKHIVIMCAESVPWRCHRSLIGDALLVRNISVIDIYSATESKQHTLTPWVKVRGMHITYPENKS